MTITELAFARSHFTAVAVAALAWIGAILYLDHPSQEDPDFTIREAVVTTRLPGMSSERIEDLVTRKVEEAARKIPEAWHITSSSRTGVSVVHVTLHDRYTDLDPIWSDLRNRMEDLKQELPDGAQGPFVNDDFGRVAVATVAITADGFSLAEMHAVAKHLRQELYVVRGTSQVDLYGVQPERIFLEVDRARLAEYGVSPNLIFDALSSQNVILPGGRVDVEGYEFVVEPTGNLEDLAELGEVPIALPNDAFAYLRDFATIRRGYVEPPETPVFFDGQPAIVLGISMVGGENIVVYGGRLRARVEQLEAALPVGYQLAFATFQPDRVAHSIDDFSGNLYQTIVVVLLVVILFLGLRTGLIVGLIVPLTILTAFVFMRLLDIPLHSVSIAALIISLGLLVDNGIVVAEDVRTRIQAGGERREAAIAAGRELALPLLSSSLTTILAFMPLYLAPNSAGEYLRSLSQVIMITLLSSWFLSLFVTPLFCAWFIRTDEVAGGAPVTDSYEGLVYQRYRGFLESILRRRLVFLAAMLAAFFASIGLFRFVSVQFFPNSARDQFLVYFDLAAGASAQHTSAEVVRFAQWLRDPESNPEVENHIAYVGSGGPRFVLGFSPPDPGTHRALLVVNVRAEADIEIAMQRAREHLAVGFPEVRPRIGKLGTGPSEPGLVEIRVVGTSRDQLMAIAGSVEDALYAIPDVIDIRNDWGNRTRKYVVRVNQARALRAGVTSHDIAIALAGAFDGSEVSVFREEDESIPILARSTRAERSLLAAIPATLVYSESQMRAIPLLQIAEFDLVWEYGDVQRRDLERTVTVAARHAVWQAADLVEALAPALAAIPLPAGYRLEEGGERESSREANKALFSSLPVCFAAIVVLLVWQFNSVRRPLIILLTIPLSLIGSVLGLLVTQAPFGFMETLGMLSLAGIIINNAIVLIDRIDLEIGRGAAPYDAVVSAAVKRLRPIVMTTLTTMVGLLPLMIFGGELWFGMAVVISAGLGGGTLLTLGVVPVLYSLFFGATPERGR